MILILRFNIKIVFSIIEHDVFYFKFIEYIVELDFLSLSFLLQIITGTSIYIYIYIST